MNVKFNIKGIIYGVIALVFVIGAFIFIPSMFVEKSKPIDYTVLQRNSIPEKILDVMDKYTNEERALAAKIDNKIYIIVTRGNNKYGIEMDKIESVVEEGKDVLRVKIKYKDKEDSFPYIVVETNMSELPDRIELNATK
ncbi:Uncharacterised protein [Clostridioides difficile]|uniref:hypothetical protein n=1 Tax=Clostridioides difficile TaxID=1496 RepID=UPI0003B28652|nr:hypothetical protein [Clostridioides difficile]CCL12813.1 Conserved hypothetical protein [Clostridioides difficile E16]CCL97188.1 Conserved hypothetical protein [Clostridioides difficile T61]SJO11341.1 Uncharacterised protein [Clostridioides difficile]SJO91367.1 Uncharacterised protein [Clostridioides difficile]SJP01192.1 Uncharacterised protein [Clostridioides difficile]